MSYGVLRAFLFTIAAVVTGTGVTCARLEAQTRAWVVDDGPDSADHEALQPVVDAANEGDVVLLRPGRYPAAAIRGKSLTLIAERPGTVLIDPANAAESGLEVSGLAAHQAVVLRGLRVEYGWRYPLLVRGNAGPVWVEDCTSRTRVRIETSAAVTLVRCTFEAGMSTQAADLHVYDCAILGSPGSGGYNETWPFPQRIPATPGSTAMTMDGGTMFVCGSTIVGGAGGSFTGGCFAAKGGDGLVLASGDPLVRTLDAHIHGGIGGSEWCGRAASGVAIRVQSGSVVTLPGVARRVQSPAVRSEADPVSWSVLAPAGDAPFLALGTAQAPVFHAGWNGTTTVQQPNLVPLPSMPSSRRLDVHLVMPPLGDATQVVQLFVQGVFVDSRAHGWLSSPSQLVGLALERPGRLGRDCDRNGSNDVWELMGGAPDADRNGVIDSCETFAMLHVDDDGPGDPAPGDPSTSDPFEDGSPQHPFDAIQEAIDRVASPGPYTIVLVAAGTYTGPGNVGIDFRGKPLTLRGAAGRGACVIDCRGSDRAFTFTSGEDYRSRIERLRIVNGAASSGGAVWVNRADPLFVDCEFVRNRGTDTWSAGGAIAAIDSGLAVLRCRFEGNSADTGGALRYIEGGTWTGIAPRTMVVRECVFEANTAKHSGAIDLKSGSTMPQLTATQFLRNHATYHGGALTVAGQRAAVDSCAFVANSGQDAAAIWVDHGSELRLRGATIVAHSGAVPVYATTYARLHVDSSILWGNGAGGPQVSLVPSVVASVAHTLIAGGPGGIEGAPDGVDYRGGNLDRDPLFANAAAGDYRLAPNSPCVDAGDPFHVPLIGERDCGGAPRRRGRAVDVGAFER